MLPSSSGSEARGARWGARMGWYLHIGSGRGVQENQHGHQGPGQDAILDLPEAQQERHAEWEQVQPWEKGGLAEGPALRAALPDS